jgi:hypothetical protein
MPTTSNELGMGSTILMTISWSKFGAGQSKVDRVEVEQVREDGIRWSGWRGQ